jgi:RNA polymerase sigma-70 factor (ECF subfamily)
VSTRSLSRAVFTGGAVPISIFYNRRLRTVSGMPSRNHVVGSYERMNVRSSEPELRTLMIAGLNGDAAAHKALLSRLGAHLRAYFKAQLIRIGRGPADAEDLVQETLIAIHTRRHTYDRSQLLTPWVHAIARYRLVDYLRRTKASALDVPIDEAEDALADVDPSAVESGLDLEKLMSQLTPKTRQAIQFVKLDGLSVREAAALSGMSESAIKVSVHRGLRALALLVRRRSSS